MGCFSSKNQAADLHPNIYRVVNIDENGVDLCSGQLEITDSDIILYREGRDSTVWPLHSLRRYGFEGEIFSFESGRRCITGEGIYGFRCRRAAVLFSTLQHQIQLLNVMHDTVTYPVSRLSPPAQGRQTLHASVVHRSSIDNGQPDNNDASHNNNLTNSVAQTVVPRIVNQSPRSPSSADILEVMPLYPRSQTSTSQVTNVYQVRDFKREHNNNQAEGSTDTNHVYCNDLNRDLAILRNTLRQESALNTIRDIEDETRFLESRYINETKPVKLISSLSPTISNSSEHYAQLSIEQQETAARMYMNINPKDPPGTQTVLPDANRNDTAPSTPLTPKQVDYCNLAVGNKHEINSYANLSIGEMIDNIKTKHINFSTHMEHNQKFSESDTFTSMSPVEEMEVNYAILDIDCKKDSFKPRDLMSPENNSYNSSRNESTASCSTHSRGQLLSQTSLDKSSGAPPAGYTTIDFEKTVALTSVASSADQELNNQRKTRHNSATIACGSPVTK